MAAAPVVVVVWYKRFSCNILNFIIVEKWSPSRHLTDFLADVVVRDDDAAVPEDELTSPTDGGGKQVRRPHNWNVLLTDTVTGINVRQQTCITVCGFTYLCTL